MRFSQLGAFATALAVLPELSLAKGSGIPSLKFTESPGAGFPLQDVQTVVVDSRFAQAKYEEGLSLIPPTLAEFAATFAEDLHAIAGSKVSVVEGSKASPQSIFLTLDDDTAKYVDAAGRKTAEGYTLDTGRSGITIKGASPLGVWWGTRTVLQQGILSADKFVVPAGTAVDAPGWETRGMALDGARHFYPKEFMIELCSYMSFFKQNTFQLHLSDNQIVNPFTMDTYARFRWWSDSESVAGLNKYRNESYTREDFDEIQTKCAARGVTILPEIEAPGHALPIVQWKPQIAYEGNLELLNLTHPDTLPTLKTIWAEFLPWFHTKVVSIGADEYGGPSDEYKIFVNALNEFIVKESGKSIRIWGTFPPDGSEHEVSTDVSIQHWSTYFDDAYNQYIKNGYSVVNSYDTFYVVLKYGAYGRKINIDTTFNGNPEGGPWYPNIFSTGNSSMNAPKDEPLIQGAIQPLWNDHGPTTSVYSEAFWAWREGIPAMADKQWGGDLTAEQFADFFPKLVGSVPAQNLARVIPSAGATIFDYDLTTEASEAVKDLSGNSNNAETNCESTGSSLSITPDCSFITPLLSKGRDYTLSLTLKVDEVADATKTTLISGTDSVLMLTPNITMFSAGVYFRLNTTIPLKEWVDLEIKAVGEQTFASFKSESGKTADKAEFLTAGVTGYPHMYPMAFEAPIHQVTGWTGELRALTLTNDG
ncbi:uncharacterized protein DNG_05922 [Cephalotrichum gorgonifer]|uniref:beta-N-acetylhexosaminidase n=1 Tax=Cephalotrichum gorgonifer TaxID=2041049 RepID=A0AAE8SVX8_9PEZI|nr:uncharacterized protein DNG_05922 [Cephalotrichum gorgonifer]